jgi:hypothetical protein
VNCEQKSSEFETMESSRQLVIRDSRRKFVVEEVGF